MTRRPMSLWRLEWLRLTRTHRWLLLFGVYVLFGVVGPLSARYLGAIVERFGAGVTIEAPDPRPVDGIVQFVSNASQLGLLAVVVVAAMALGVDARPERAAFLRTKTPRPGRLVVPPAVTTWAAATAALVAGTAVAAVLTGSLIGPLPAGAVVVGTAYASLYLGFAVAVVAVTAGVTRSQAASVFAALGVLLAFPIAGVVDPLRPWLPSALLTAVAALVEGAPAAEFFRAAAVTVTATAVLLAVALRRFRRREL